MIRKLDVVPYIGTWIETLSKTYKNHLDAVVPYIGTWIETVLSAEIKSI